MDIFWFAIAGMIVFFLLLAFTGDSDYYDNLFADTRKTDATKADKRNIRITLVLTAGFVICFFTAFVTFPFW